MSKPKLVVSVIIVIVVMGVIVTFGSAIMNTRLGSAPSSQNYSDSVSRSAGGRNISMMEFLAPSASKSSRGPSAADGGYESNSTNTVPDKIDSRLIIKTARLTVVVKDVTASVKKISDLAIQYGGFIVSSNIYKKENAPYASIVIRIDANKFDQGFNSIQGLGEVTQESVNGKDVTEEYVDIQAQLKTQYALELRYLSILEKADTIPNILSVEQQLSSVREKIERIEGRKKYLEQSAKLSTITINLSTDPDVLPTIDKTEKWKPIAVAKEAIRNMVLALQWFANIAISIVIFTPVWLIIGLILILIVKGIKRAFKGNKIE